MLERRNESDFVNRSCLKKQDKLYKFNNFKMRFIIVRRIKR